MLIKLVEYGVPLPLSKSKNQRSFMGIDNLVDLVIVCISHPEAASQILLAGDDNDLSTTKLLRECASDGKPSRLFPCPPSVLGALRKFLDNPLL